MLIVLAPLLPSLLALAGNRIHQDRLPPKVAEAIRKLAEGHRIQEIETEVRNKVTVYEAEWKVDGVEVSVTVDADGRLIERERTIPITTLPPVVRQAAENAVPHIRLKEAEQITVGARTSYEVEGRAGGRKYELRISADGAQVRTVDD